MHGALPFICEQVAVLIMAGEETVASADAPICDAITRVYVSFPVTCFFFDGVAIGSIES